MAFLKMMFIYLALLLIMTGCSGGGDLTGTLPQIVKKERDAPGAKSSASDSQTSIVVQSESNGDTESVDTSGSDSAESTVVDKTVSSVSETVAKLSPHDILATGLSGVIDNYLGKSYLYGAEPDETDSSDCSHLLSALVRAALVGTQYVFEPYYLTTGGFFDNSSKIDLHDARVGDIIFFKSSEVQHAAVITGIRGSVVSFIHASSSRGVVIETTESSSWLYYWRSHFHSWRRINSALFSSVETSS